MRSKGTNVVLPAGESRWREHPIRIEDRCPDPHDVARSTSAKPECCGIEGIWKVGLAAGRRSEPSTYPLRSNQPQKNLSQSPDDQSSWFSGYL